MKRFVTLLLAVLLALPALAAGAEGTAARNGINLTYDRIVDMALYMRQLAMGDYLDIKAVPEAQQTVAEGWAAGINDTPRLVVQLNLEALAALTDIRLIFSQESDVVLLEAESNVVVDVWQYLAYYAGEEAGLTGSSYEEIMTVNGYINAQMTYAQEVAEGYGLYIVLYEDASPLLYIVSAENGAVCIRGLFLPSTKLQKCENYGDVALWLLFNGFAMTCEEIKPE